MESVPGQPQQFGNLEANLRFIEATDVVQPGRDVLEIGTGTGALPFPNASFDIVVSFDVLEHIPDTDAHLAEVSRVLRPGGAYLIQTPNKWMNVIFETIRWRSFTKFREDHCSLHTLGELVARLDRHGFDARAYDVPVVNDFFRSKMRRY